MISLTALITIAAVFLCANVSARAFARKSPRYANLYLTLIPALLKAGAISLLMSHHAVTGLLKDTLSASIVVGLSAIFALSCFFGLSTHSEFKLNKSRWIDNLSMLMLVFMVMLFSQRFITDFQYSKWLSLVSVLLVALYVAYIATQNKSQTSYSRCYLVAFNAKLALPAWQHIVLLIVSCVTLYFILTILPIAAAFADGSMNYQVFAILFMLATFSSEIYVGFKLAKANKGQSAALVMTGSVLSSVLICFPLVSLYCYFANVDSVSLMGDLQMTMVVGVIGLSYMLHQNQKPTWMEFSMFSTLFLAYFFSCM